MPLLLLLVACGAPHVAPPAPAGAQDCIAGWSRTAEASLVAEQRAAASTPWIEAPEYVLSVPVGEPLVPARHTAQWLLGDPIFWFDETHQHLYVDNEAFDTLHSVQPSRLQAGQSVLVGQVLPQTRVALGDRAVVELLIESDMLRIYEGGTGRVCLVDEETRGGDWFGHLVGELDTTKPLNFHVRVDGGGRILVTGA